jgi:hypothetical protein
MYSSYKYWQHECQYHNAYTHYQGPVVPKHNHSTLLWFKYQSKIYLSQAFLHFSVSLSLLTHITQHITEMLYGCIHIAFHLQGGQCIHTSQMFNLKRLHKNNQLQQHHPHVFLWILLKTPNTEKFHIFHVNPTEHSHNLHVSQTTVGESLLTNVKIFPILLVTYHAYSIRKR